MSNTMVTALFVVVSSDVKLRCTQVLGTPTFGNGAAEIGSKVQLQAQSLKPSSSKDGDNNLFAFCFELNVKAFAS